MSVLWATMLAQAAAATPPMDVGKGPVSTTTVAVTVILDPKGRVLSCRPGPGAGVAAACAGFKKGRVVSAPLSKNGKPVGGVMTVSTTSVVSAK